MSVAVPISVATHLKSEPKSVECSCEMSYVVDEKDDVIDLLFLAESSQEQHGELRYSCLKQLHVEELVRVGSTVAYSQWC